MRVLLMLLLFAMAGGATAQEVPARRVGGTTYVQASALVRAMGLVTRDDGRALTVETGDAVLVFFAGAAEVSRQPRDGDASEESLGAPVVADPLGWWLPLDAVHHLGVEVAGDGLLLPGGEELLLRLPPPLPRGGVGGAQVDLGGVPGLRLFAAGPAGSESLSLLLADVGLLGLRFPEQREVFDAFVAELPDDRPLLAVVTAVEPSEWPTSLTFRQGELVLEARQPFRLRLLEGDPNRVGPDHPVVAVVLLTAEFNLRRPIEVTWGEAAAEVTFRR